jgi:hypothetical protein
MSRRPKASEPAISLFSFLDTLMCTMGALILLLIGLSIRMRPNASLEELLKSAGQPVLESPAAEEPPAELPPRYTAEDRVRDLAERAARRASREAEWSQALARAQSERDRERTAVDKRRRALAQIDRKLEGLRSRGATARDEAERTDVARKEALDAEEKLKGLEDQVVQQIEATRRNLDLEQRKQASRANEFAIVPYDGTSGTLRRPIYIECLHNGYRFLSEDVFVGPQQLDGFTANYNPLLTGTQALLRYWNARRIAAGGNEPEPYVLLIVRPSGCLSYYLARKLLAPVGANFGYELIEEDRKLAVPNADPQSCAVLRDAIEITVEAREKVRDSFASAGSSGGSFGFNDNHRSLSRGNPSEGFEPGGARGGRGGFGGRETGGPDEGAAGRSVAGRARGGLAGDPGGGPARAKSNPRGVSRPFADGFGEESAGGTPPTPGGTNQRGSQEKTGGGSRTLAGNLSGGRGGSARGAAGGEGGFGGGFGEGPGEEAGFADPDSPPTDGAGGSGRKETRGQETGGSGSRNGRSGGARPATLGGHGVDFASDEPPGTGNARRGARRSGPAGAAGGGGDEPSMEPLPDEFGSPRGNSPRMTTKRGPRAPAHPAMLGGQGADFASEDSGSGDAPMGTGGPTSGRGRRGNAKGRAAGGNPSAGSGQEGAPGGGAVGESASGTVAIGQNSGGGSSGGTPPPGGRRQWGQAHARAGTGLEKKLEIHAWRDRLMIGPNNSTIPIHQGEKTDELLQRVLGGIEETAQSWGPPPGKNFYWIPAVKFVVHSGGNGAYERLRGPLEKQGVSSSVHYSTEKPAARSAGGTRR